MRITQTKFPWPAHATRTPGLHLTDVTRDMLDTPPFVESECAWAGFGLAWELALLNEPDFAHVIPGGEVECDGILCTPDGFDPANNAVVEIKFTWRNVHSPSAKPEWIWQTAAYCHALGVRRVDFYVGYVLGARPFCPARHRWIVEFQEHEIAERWHAITQHAASMRAKARHDVVWRDVRSHGTGEWPRYHTGGA